MAYVCLLRPLDKNEILFPGTPRVAPNSTVDDGPHGKRRLSNLVLEIYYKLRSKRLATADSSMVTSQYMHSLYELSNVSRNGIITDPHTTFFEFLQKLRVYRTMSKSRLWQLLNFV